MRRIVCIGECMIELSQAGDGLWRMGYAGDTLNTAWYLRAKLGSEWQVSYVTRVGQDRFSGEMLEFLNKAGIDTTAIPREADRNIGLYAISLSEGERSFSYWRGQSAARGLADDRAALDAALSGAELCYFSGITVAILPPEGRANLFAALAAAKARGAKLAFDPNIRERLWSDHATLRSAITDAAALADIILPSFDDEAMWFGDADPKATADRYGALGVGEIVVKNGGGELCLRKPDGSEANPHFPSVTPTDTTGAGDSFNGGYLAARLNGADMDQAARAGHDLAARVVCHPGALIAQADLV
ncbi:sugar kinase [Paracoccus sp. (in: a-proteobacteria)]|uniref:sugar kinase n=1 Tax=Paracoccus sp. TaxID=267 RepID=UPI0028A0A621|nr:sugar kinase [Paracoccus sp. (in: a-proteobacteria)]